MNLISFTTCFKELCLAFDLEYGEKSSRMGTYFDSFLGDMTEHAFLELIKQAKETLEPKQGFLPPIRKLINVYYNGNVIKFKQKNKADMENFYDAICPICNNIGFVTLERKDGEMCGGYCCTCSHGQNKLTNTTLGRSLGVYTNWIGKGYKLPGEIIPF